MKTCAFFAIFGFIISSCIYPKLNSVDELSPAEIFTANNTYTRSSYQHFTIGDSLMLDWEDNISGQAAYSLLQMSGNLIFTTRNGYLYFIEIDNPRNFSKKRILDGSGTSPTIHESTLYITANMGNNGLTVYDMINGSILWQLENMLSQSAPLIFNNSIIHTSTTGDIICLDLSNYEEKWKVELNDKILNNLALIENNLIVASQNGIVRNYDPGTGSLNWSLKVNSAIYASPVIDTESVFIGCYNGDFIKIDIKSGDIENRINLKVPIYFPPGLDNENLFIPLSNGNLIKTRKNNLDNVWIAELNGPFSASLLVTENKIITGTASNNLYIIDKSSGIISQNIKLEGRLRVQPAIYNNKVIIVYEPDIISIFSIKAGDHE